MLAFAFVAQTPPTEIPLYAAYSEPLRPDADEDTPPTSDQGRLIVWYGEAKSKTTIQLSVRAIKADGQTLLLTVGKTQRKVAFKNDLADFGSFEVNSGPVRVACSLGRIPGSVPEALLASGNVRWNTSRRLNAASVHLRWPVEKGADIRWFYNEAAMLTDPIWSYTMACGFARGYFGMQVNSPTERRIIFSVWDSGNEAVSRDKVAAEDRVQLIAKGDNVVADSFGNEGTGGHSHLILPWKTGKPVKFLVGCRPDGTHTLYAGYFMAPGDKSWRLVAAFRAPKDGGPLRDLYSFSEDFVGNNGQAWRESAYGNGWLGLADGTWRPITEAKFTTDGHGKTERWDYDAFLKGGQFHLRHGGYLSGTAKYGDTLTKEKPKGSLKIQLPILP